jgi:predicted RND superfamily exporter protein
MSDFISKTLRSPFSMLLAPIFVLLIATLFFTQVDLEPKITPDFFFSSDSQIYKEDQAIQKKFPFNQQILLNVSTDSISDPNYIEKIDTLSTRVKSLQGVKDVNSITHGPDDLDAARGNPLWRRMLIGENEKSSFVAIFVSTENYQKLVADIETIVAQEENKYFSIRISGLPYIVEQIRRNLKADMKTFTTGAIILSSIVLLLVFRSIVLVAGALITCITAAMLTLVIQAFMGIPIGILTANLGTIVFVLTQSHLIFLVANWYNAARKSNDARLQESIKHTFPASFWAMMTTLLGFSSLIFVEAKPLNQLGIGGAIGTLSALICAYTIFPAFLRMGKINPSRFSYSLANKFPLPKKLARFLSIATILIAITLGVFGISRLNTDPSLLSYFKEDSKLYNGIYHVDKNGGSNPLHIVVRQNNGATLDNDASYERMWELQNAFSAHESVGSVISLPVIMAEGDEHWLGNLLPWNILLDILSKPRFGEITKSFVSEDRTEALFMLRMNEGERAKDRLSIIREVKQIPPDYGFEITMVGGTYYLQGELASSVASSMTTGIMTLIALFGVIAFALSASLIVALAIIICAASITAITLGTLGILGIPVDIISSPAVNLCLGLIVDDMIHLTVTAKRHAKEMKENSMRKWGIWREALNGQSWPALVSTITIMIGFSVFALSDFPPSQRFGLEIVYGAGLAVILALGVFPFLATRRKSGTK